MTKTVLIYGAIAGVIIIVTKALILAFAGSAANAAGSEWLGYLVIVLALSVVFFGVKRQRDDVQGGVISFWSALGVGLLISAIAGAAYVAVWEVYLAITGEAFIETYTGSLLEEKARSGAAPAELEAFQARMDAMKEQYANPFFRLPITFLELFPVGLLISLISAAVLRNPQFLKASV